MRTGRDKGFTLIEMMVALVVLAVLVVVGAPAFSELIKNNRMLSSVYAMRAALNGARSEALAQRTPVTLCRSDDDYDEDQSCSLGDWNTGFIAFLDVDKNGVVGDPNDEPIFISKVIDNDTLVITYNRTTGSVIVPDDRVQFDSRGYVANGTQGILTVCDDRGDDHARGLAITPGGIVKAVEDPNDLATCP